MKPRQRALIKQELRLYQIERLLVTGTTSQAAIADRLGVHESTVSRDLKCRELRLTEDVRNRTGAFRSALLTILGEGIHMALEEMRLRHARGDHTYRYLSNLNELSRTFADLSGARLPTKHMLLHGFVDEKPVEQSAFNGKLEIVGVPHDLGPETTDGKPLGPNNAPLETLLLHLDTEGNVIKPPKAA